MKEVLYWGPTNVSHRVSNSVATATWYLGFVSTWTRLMFWTYNFVCCAVFMCDHMWGIVMYAYLWSKSQATKSFFVHSSVTKQYIFLKFYIFSCFSVVLVFCIRFIACGTHFSSISVRNVPFQVNRNVYSLHLINLRTDFRLYPVRVRAFIVCTSWP